MFSQGQVGDAAKGVAVELDRALQGKACFVQPSERDETAEGRIARCEVRCGACGDARRYYWVGTVTGRADFDRSLEAARLALSIDPQLARAH